MKSSGEVFKTNFAFDLTSSFSRATVESQQQTGEEMAFEKFVPSSRPRTTQVSIKRAGTISFDRAAAIACGLDRATHATLHFDPAHKLIGVKPAGAGEDGALRLSHRTRVSSLRARAFFEFYGIELTVTRRYAITFDSAAGMAVIPLGAVKRRRGPRPKQP